VAVSLGKPRFRVVFLGFPWILSSETILINGLRGKIGVRNFQGGLAPWAAVGLSERPISEF
jgi:hypothetical protein